MSRKQDEINTNNLNVMWGMVEEARKERDKARAEIARLNELIGVYGRADRVKAEEVQRLRDALASVGTALVRNHVLTAVEIINQALEATHD